MTTREIDRASLVRRAVVELVAETGIQGATMAEVARRAGVATGTAYVHYESKEHLLVAAFVEVKQQLGAAAIAGLGQSAAPREIFEQVWKRSYRHLRTDPARARFLIRIDESPLRHRAHESLPGDDLLTSLASEMAPHLVDLPIEIVYELGLAPAVRLAAREMALDETSLDLIAGSCWRAISPTEDVSL